MTLAIEITIVTFNTAFILLMIARNIACWIFGVAASLLGIWLSLQGGLINEAWLYSFYVLMGIYGWWKWKRQGVQEVSTSDIQVKSGWFHLKFIALGAALTILVGFLSTKVSQARLPYEDAFSSVFGVLATWLEANKYLYSWIYWIILNFFTVWLYHQREFDILAIQMFFFGLLSIWGFFQWRTHWKKLN